MKKVRKLLPVFLCLTLLLGCAGELPAGSTVPAPSGETPTERFPPQLLETEILKDGVIMAGPGKVYEFADDRPEFSLDGALYNCALLVELKTRTPAAIYYTLDGSDPDREDLLYEGGIRVTVQEASDFPTPTVIKARAYYENGTASQIAVRTYFVAENVKERFSTVVFAINGDPAELTEGPEGIFYGENALERGDDTEREVFVEAWDSEGNRMFSQYSGLRIYGGWSRYNSIKSMKLYARKRYSSGIGKFHTDIFGTPVEDDSGAVVDEYDKLVLRNAGNDFQYSFVRDELYHTLAMQAGFTDYEAVVPAVAYLNGEYYGLFWLHENYCDDYFKNKYPNKAAQGEFVIVEGAERWKNSDEDGDRDAQTQEYCQMYDRYAYADLTDDAVYQELCQLVDVENYLRYYALNIYINNHDWPTNNYKCYRYVPAEGETLTGVYDGRWRYLLHDMDYSTHLYESDELAADFNNISQILDPEHTRYAPLLAALMHRPECREYFMDYMRQLSWETLCYANATKTLNWLHNWRSEELPYLYKHIANLRAQGDDSLWTNAGVMEHNLEIIDKFISFRQNYILYYTAEALKPFE